MSLGYSSEFSFMSDRHGFSLALLVLKFQSQSFRFPPKVKAVIGNTVDHSASYVVCPVERWCNEMSLEISL